MWYLVMLIPLTTLGIGLFLLSDAVRFSRTAQPAEGEVISVERQHGENGVTYRPSIRYRTAAGEIRTAPTHISSSGYDYPIGARVRILYDPDAPGSVRIDSPVSLYLLPAAFLGSGLITLIVLGSLRHRFPTGKPAEAERDPEAPSEI